MKVRARVAESVVRLALLCAAGAVLRWATVSLTDWREEIQSTFEHTWGGWAATLGLVAAAGFLVGLATLPARPRGYRLLVPLVVTVPALLLLAHFVFVIENARGASHDLPWILDQLTFYMEITSQFVLALVAGLGIASGLQPGARVEEPASAVTTPAS